MPDLHTEFSRLLPADEIAELSPTLLKDQRNRFTSAPDIILQPRSVESVQTIMRFCYEHRIPVTPQGGNTGLCGAAVSENGVLLNLSKLNRIRSINLSDNCITVEAGSVLQTVQQAAEASNRLFPLSLASEGSCQIGGNIACNAGGLNVLRYGTMRDLVIGSEGTLGIITAATLKLFANPLDKATAWVGIPDIESAVRLLTETQAHFAERLCSFELIGRFAAELSSEFSKLPLPTHSEWHILLELTDSLPDSNLDDRLVEFLYKKGFTDSVLAQSEQERIHMWALRENISASQRKLGTSIKHDIAVPIGRVADFVRRCAKDLEQNFKGIQIVCFGHLGDGSLHYNTFLPEILSNEVYRYENDINSTVYRNVLACNGTIAAEHGIGIIKKQWLDKVRTPAEIALMKSIKQHLDPYNIMNPGKLLP